MSWLRCGCWKPGSHSRPLFAATTASEDLSRRFSSVSDAQRCAIIVPIARRAAGAATGAPGFARSGHSAARKGRNLPAWFMSDPNFAWGWLVSSWIKCWSGEPDVAIEDAARAMRLSPADPHTFTMRTATGSAHFFAARHSEALAWVEEVAWERPSFLIANAVMAAAVSLAGRSELATRAITRLREIEPPMPSHRGLPGMTVPEC